MLTKSETRVIFDKNNIGVNDLVLFRMEVPKGFIGSKVVYRHGLINEVHDTYVTIRVTSVDDCLGGYVCDATEADRLHMIERAIKL